MKRMYFVLTISSQFAGNLKSVVLLNCCVELQLYRGHESDMVSQNRIIMLLMKAHYNIALKVLLGKKILQRVVGAFRHFLSNSYQNIDTFEVT